jgi:hypothetical protein
MLLTYRFDGLIPQAAVSIEYGDTQPNCVSQSWLFDAHAKDAGQHDTTVCVVSSVVMARSHALLQPAGQIPGE